MFKFRKKEKKVEEEKPKEGLSLKAKKTPLSIRIALAFCVVLFLTVTIYILKILLDMQILPTKYLAIIIVVLLSLVAIGVLLFFFSKRHIIPAIVASILYTLLSVAIIFGAGYLTRTQTFFKNTTARDYYVANYSVLVLNDAPYRRLEDVDGKRIATYIDAVPSYSEAFEEIKKIIQPETVIKDTYYDAAVALKNKEVDFILLSDSYVSMMNDAIEDFSNTVRSIADFEIKIYDVVEVHDVDVLSEPFNIFLSGIDTKGAISNVSRSDVNMILTINPKNHKVLLTSIPRDYYVQLHGTAGIKDKLTHSGIYGPKMTVKTVEELLGIRINYFIRVNFSSLINLVNSIGGIYFTPDITISHNQDGVWCHYNKNVRAWYNGHCALRYVRERKAYADGDLHRIQNQQLVLGAIMDKLMSAEIIKNYSSILSAIEGNFETSVPEQKIYQLINNQLDTMPKWNVENYHLSGTDSYSNIYSSEMSGTGNNGSSYYVMEPDMATVEAAKAKIDALFEE